MWIWSIKPPVASWYDQVYPSTSYTNIGVPSNCHRSESIRKNCDYPIMVLLSLTNINNFRTTNIIATSNSENYSLGLLSTFHLNKHTLANIIYIFIWWRHRDMSLTQYTFRNEWNEFIDDDTVNSVLINALSDDLNLCKHDTPIQIKLLFLVVQ